MHVGILLLTFLLLNGCGHAVPMEFDESVMTQLGPLVTRVAPAAGKAGDTIAIFGFGFSAEPAENIVIVGDRQAVVVTYGLAIPPGPGEIEQLTFVVPADAAVGATTIAVLVVDRISNSDIAFTVTP